MQLPGAMVRAPYHGLTGERVARSPEKEQRSKRFVFATAIHRPVYGAL